MEAYIKRIMKYRFFAIDLLFFVITGGLVGFIVKFVEYDNALKKSYQMNLQDIIDTT